MLNQNNEPDMEMLAAEVHGVYCTQYEAKHGKAYWTMGNYDLLDEDTKEFDRAIVRWHLKRITDNA